MDGRRRREYGLLNFLRILGGDGLHFLSAFGRPKTAQPFLSGYPEVVVLLLLCEMISNVIEAWDRSFPAVQPSSVMTLAAGSPSFRRRLRIRGICRCQQRRLRWVPGPNWDVCCYCDSPSVARRQNAEICHGMSWTPPTEMDSAIGDDVSIERGEGPRVSSFGEWLFL